MVVGDGGGGGVVVGGGGVLLIQCFERLREGVYQNRTSANKGEGGPNFGHFVIT